MGKKLLGSLELNRIYQFDCVEGMKLIPDNSVDLIITSPPYNIGKMHSNHIQFGTYAGNDMKEPEYQKWQIDVLNQCYRILKPEGSMFYNHKVRIKNGSAIHPLEWILNSDFILKQEITWDMGKSANCDKIRFFPFSERIYWLTKSPKTKLHNKLNLSDVWRVVPTHKRKETGHIAVMPEEIVTNVLECLDGQIVFDPFTGSGTTCIVAKRFNRDFIGFELNPEYIETANKRLDDLELS
ncbi:DNA-methyltransferase [Bacillus subtilis]|uniref:DNA-methyltransferase n=1 Tax=Bacillus subtilis TaxID=1423 RepID=UPI002416528E|nr:site-specific DNA-methyltransferase [Bacillus subtilis]WFO97882.1 site-specific DNA-methyltransferase [Bacillus subtilis]